MKQMSLLDVLGAYADGAQSNEQAYARIGSSCGLPQQAWAERKPIGKDEALHSPLKIKARWTQQTLRKLGLLEPVAGRRGHWQATAKGRQTLKQREENLEPSQPGVIQLGFSTELGIALWGDCRDVFSRIDEDLHLVLTSPPYGLSRPRAYGNPSRDDYVDWLCSCLEPVVKRLAPGGNLFLNVSNDCFEKGSPARSLIQEELTIALHKRLDLSVMDRWIWSDPSKAPGPIQWASLQRVQVNTGYEPILWFTNDPMRCLADNRRILKPHTKQHLKYMAAGGATSAAVYGDGANRRRVGAFSSPTAGSIARNVITIPHKCPSQLALRKWCKEQGIPVHGATMPLALAEHIVRFATQEGMVLADICAGWLTTALAAERNNRRWIVAEKMRAYLHAAQWRMLEYLADEA